VIAYVIGYRMTYILYKTYRTNDLTTTLSLMVCHTWPRSCYDQPMYQVWSFYLYPLRRYERRYKISKMGWFGVVWGS